MSRKLEALKRLAERPGTEAEGEVARAMLKKLKAKEKADPKPKARKRNFDDWLRDLNGPVSMKCACGDSFMSNEACKAAARHENIRAEVAARFSKGDTVFYNKWAYNVNSKGVVVGFVKPDALNWGWIRVRFDHLKTDRAVPIYSVYGWHLSNHPLNFTEIGDLRYPDNSRGAEWAPRLA